ncbi:histidine--tRNA ligase [Methylobrevis albus]|uniref:Histidine--tRNA ligase n=1 Tax=Methylobrevis albus TaxID=2793297 RepID=A0A931I3I6_9HYPH|nr:histidine--tRNA ligase [Methylobrevis albus]MBH0238213.1 histidine--tRNA ligase [Methylobrevis albus]
MSAGITEARLPRGFVDRTPDEIRASEAMMRVIRETYERYGFEPVETPLVEFTDALGKFLPDQDRPNEGVFSFQDDDEQWLSLRYDLTAPLARLFAENHERLPKPYRSYRAGWVFRNEKPGPGRFRQFMQFDADTVGAASVAADAEMCMMMADTLEALGIPRGQYVVRVNNRKVLDGAMEAAGLAAPEQAAVRLNAMRALDKFDKFGLEGVALLLGPGRRDESGDFTKGCGLDAGQIELLLAVLDGKGLESLSGVLAASPRGQEGVAELVEIGALIRAAGYRDDRIRIDTSVVRGLEYYTGPVYEAELLFETKNDDGQPVRFGSVGGGGRYDGLVGRFLKENVPATGFSIGVSRLTAALKALGKLSSADARGPVVVLVMDRSAIASYQTMVAELRKAGIRAEMYLGSSGMKPQMKYADRRGAPIVVIEGSNEREAHEVQLKDLALGKEMSKDISDNEIWRASRPAQVTVKRADLVAEVKRMLGAAGGRTE